MTSLCTGNLQQKAAAVGALQALAYCPGRLDISAGIAAEGGIEPLVHMVTEGPMPLRSAAAGALCNLALASPHNQVTHSVTACLVLTEDSCQVKWLALAYTIQWASVPAMFMLLTSIINSSKYVTLCSIVAVYNSSCCCIQPLVPMSNANQP